MSPVILILLGAIVGTGIVLRLLHRPDLPSETDQEVEKTAAYVENRNSVNGDSECCGQHAVCERDSLLTGIDANPIYFDDEELDIYRGRSSGDYTDEETEQFRDVLLTLLPDDVAPWARSISERGIVLPDGVRDELLMMIQEIRQSRKTNNV